MKISFTSKSLIDLNISQLFMYHLIALSNFLRFWYDSPISRSAWLSFPLSRSSLAILFFLFANSRCYSKGGKKKKNQVYQWKNFKLHQNGNSHPKLNYTFLMPNRMSQKTHIFSNMWSQEPSTTYIQFHTKIKTLWFPYLSWQSRAIINKNFKAVFINKEPRFYHVN